ncbi:MAG: formylglycine-generating enzyme family protein [Desulfobacteraceae bacterium]|nr:MAG: formylglycine-generating enzyme family protein [Desulfobacteraceae bacterium]
MKTKFLFLTIKMYALLILLFTPIFAAENISSKKLSSRNDSPGKTFVNSINQTFVYIMPGTFLMGSPETEYGRYDDEIQHRVTITKGFYLQTTEVTQGHWNEVMEHKPWHRQDFVKEGDQYPAVYISYSDMQEFIRRLNSKEGTEKYRLPTEAEWEYACRAGSQTRYSFGNDKQELSKNAWIDKNTFYVGEKYPHQVAKMKPNVWGLYDMHGNVYEVCLNWYYDYSSEKLTDPKGPIKGDFRVSRGGCWRDDSETSGCRAAIRHRIGVNDSNSYLGFRLVKEN